MRAKGAGTEGGRAVPGTNLGIFCQRGIFIVFLFQCLIVLFFCVFMFQLLGCVRLANVCGTERSNSDQTTERKRLAGSL